MKVLRETHERFTFATAAEINNLAWRPEKDIPMEGTLAFIDLWFHLTNIIAVDTGAASVEDQPKSMFKAIDVKLHGKGSGQAGVDVDSIVTPVGAGVDLYRLNLASNEGARVTASGITVATHEVYLGLRIPFMCALLEPAIITALELERYEKLDVRVLFGSADGGSATAGVGDLVTGTPAGFSMTVSGTMDIILGRLIDLTREEKQMVGRGLYFLESRRLGSTVPASAVNFAKSMPTGGRYVAALYRALDAGARTDARVTHLAVRKAGGEDAIDRTPFLALQSQGLSQFPGLVPGDRAAGHVEMNFAQSRRLTETLQTGNASIDTLVSTDATWAPGTDELVCLAAKFAPFGPATARRGR